MLRAVKNRFGPTDEVGCFDMSGEGIEEVTDPAGLFLSGDGPDAANAAPVEGTCVTFTLDGHRSLPIEVQALVTTSVLPTPRRAVNGVDPSRIAMLVAVLYRHSKLNLLSNDLYISTIAGGQAKEPGSDLAIVAALASAATSKPGAPGTAYGISPSRGRTPRLHHGGHSATAQAGACRGTSAGGVQHIVRRIRRLGSA